MMAVAARSSVQETSSLAEVAILGDPAGIVSGPMLSIHGRN